MYRTINKITAILLIFSALMFSCKDLDEMNENPNGVDTESGEAYLFLGTVITYTGSEVIDLGFGDLAGVMQHTQKDGWSGSHNSYDWDDFDWSSFYTTLRNTQEMLEIAQKDELGFYEGVGLMIKALNFAMITDLWGDAPFSNSLQGEDGVLQASYDSQEDIYAGVLSYLEEANTLLSKDEDEYFGIKEEQDLLYEGDVAQWQKLANSLALRYYMRLSEKDQATAKAGVEKIAGGQDTYPIMLDASDDADYEYVGNSSSDSWPSTIEFDESESNFSRIQMCATLVEKLQGLNDPRLGVWAAKVEIPTVIDESKEDGYNEVVDGVRVIAKNIADNFYDTYGYEIDTDPEYVGLPPAWNAAAYLYNYNEASQGDYNPYASQLNDMYKESTGNLLKARIMTAAEVNFILAEAALKGWSVGGSASDYYYAGIKASFDTWGLSSSYDDYVQESGVVYDGTVKQIMEQKWISSWTMAAEAWFDWRRTGYPELEAGPVSARAKLPIRFFYGTDELYYNSENTDNAIEESLETTGYSLTDGKNSCWSKMWLLQGTSNPY